MKKINFNADWTVSDNMSFGDMTGDATKLKLPVAEKVHLPHDYMILKERDRDAKGGWGTGYFPTSTKKYVKLFDVPEEWRGKRVIIEFEGAYSNAIVAINANYAGKHPFGYSNFYLDITRFLKYGQQNKLAVTIKNGMGNNARWYSGEGLYRNVNLYVSDMLRILPEGVKISTPAVGTDVSDVLIKTEIESYREGYRKVRAVSTVYDADGKVVGENSSPARIDCGEKATLRHHVFVYDAKLWSPDSPYLYRCETKLYDGDELVDTCSSSFGIREIRLDPKYGLRINGVPTEIFGGCFHHDNGVIGACAFDRAEERKVELFKKAGFNAMRSSHNPASKALLSAADRLGVLIMDESFDMWNKEMLENDYSLWFEEWWERDLTAMIEKDYNHPSVIMYSIGNEIPERDGTSDGGKWARRQAELVRSIDDTRIVASGICGIMSEGGDIADLMVAMMGVGDQEGMSTFMENLAGNDFAALSEDYASPLDLVGYNYMHARYEQDVKSMPNRLITGTESGAMNIAAIWKEVRKSPAVLGDFTWTGMDYIGECGCGKIDYDKLPAVMMGCYPWILAYCGDIDLIGNRRPQSYYRETVCGGRKQPYTVVARPERMGQTPETTDWSWHDVISSWTFPGFEGKLLDVSVYSDADEVALYLNGRQVGRERAGEEHDWMASFKLAYEPGELTAAAIRGGVEAERFTLTTAGAPAAICMSPDRTAIAAGAEDLSYIDVCFTDANGQFIPYMKEKIRITVEGAGTLQGSGSADPTTAENYFDAETTTYDGRMLAVVRSGEAAGKITVTASAAGLPDAVAVIECI